MAGTIPWQAPEELHYALTDLGGAALADGIFTIEQDGDTYLLSTRYESPNGNSDTITVVVDAQTLKPVSSVREIENDNPDDEDRIEVQYSTEPAEPGRPAGDPVAATIITAGGDKQTGMSIEEHSYDNDSSLFLWRTLPFAEGYESSYKTIITNQRSEQQVVLRVTGKETVTVPAGEFTAWRLEIVTSNARQIAWYADTPERPLVRYDNDRGTVWELIEGP